MIYNETCQNFVNYQKNMDFNIIFQIVKLEKHNSDQSMNACLEELLGYEIMLNYFFINKMLISYIFK
jgi:hypothetical protein